MNKLSTDNKVMLEIVAAKLNDLLDDFVFLGGATTGLFLTDPAVDEPRPTIDVDVIVEVHSRVAYNRIGEKLRGLGFSEDSNSNVTCRWKTGKIILDVMPTNEEILGFSNRWYMQAIQESTFAELSEKTKIRIVTPQYYLATKIEAFLDRGNNNFSEGKDLEDIISLVEGRPELVDEISNSNAELKKFVAETFKEFLSEREFLDYLPGHLTQDETANERAPIILRRFGSISKL